MADNSHRIARMWTCALLEARINPQLRKDRLASRQDRLIHPALGRVAFLEGPVRGRGTVRHRQRRRLSNFGPPRLRNRRRGLDRLATHNAEQVGPGPRDHIQHRVAATAGRDPTARAELVGEARQRQI